MLPDSYHRAISAKRAAEQGAPVPANATAQPVDPEYADVDEDGQLSLGVAGDQRAIPGLARPRQEG